MSLHKLASYRNLQVFYGDIHNHCGLSYGNGSIEEAYQNARLQLDFASVTIHGYWPDLPDDDPHLDYLVEYHQTGFKKAYNNWVLYQEVTESQHRDGDFVTFPSFEWHSMAYGDHCIYFKETAPSQIIAAENLPSLRSHLRSLNTSTFLIPHHIGYKSGFRGINWSAYTEELSPVAEIFSFHGLSESSEGPYPYLHSMGPRHQYSTAQHGWAQGHVFGVVASTDHHNAHPGSYGYGMMGVWAPALTRDAIWNAIAQRRTYALTGDKIELDFALNGHMMGSICPPDQERWIEVMVRGGDSIDYVEVLHNNRIIHRESVFDQSPETGIYKIYVEVGWGEADNYTSWDIDLRITEGDLLNIEPRFRGHAPNVSPGETDYAFSSIETSNQNRLRFTTKTRPNPGLFSPATEGVCLEIRGTSATILNAHINDQSIELSVRELLEGARSYYMAGFVSPAVCFHRAVHEAEFSTRFAFLHRAQPTRQDWYYVRVRQRNNHYAWSSPIWVSR